MIPVAVPLREEEFRLLRELIYEHCGLVFADEMRRHVARKLAPRLALHGLADFAAYHRLLRFSPGRRAELEAAAELLTTNETYLFREPQGLRAFAEELLPRLQQELAGVRRLRVWSAGCANGEEPYSLALLICERPQVVRQHSTRIYATDIDPDCLRVAREGWYAPASLATVPPGWRRRYFTPVNNGYQVVPEVRRLVQFLPHNMLDPVPFGRIDLAVLRNVLIYMTEPLQERVLTSVAAALNPGGYLVLGRVEGVAGAAKRFFEPVRISERIFRKPAALPAAAASESPGRA